jgi:MOSC domain-containing protein YiiM
MGENITTKGINLVELPLGTLLHLGETVTLEVTGLRNPCPLIEEYKTDLYKMFRDDKRNLIRKAGIMSVVLKAGSIISNDVVTVELPSEPHKELGFL